MARKSLAPSTWGRQTVPSSVSSSSSSSSSTIPTPNSSSSLPFSLPFRRRDHTPASQSYSIYSNSTTDISPHSGLSRSPSQASHYSHSSLTSQSHHPYASMAPAPLPVVSSHGMADEEDECPVCLEPLSFSFRLPGEKPHIIPECGHALHEACFAAVYGPPPGAARAGLPRKSNLGVCGVCRRPMKVGDGDGGKSNKLAALTGMGERNTPAVYPGRHTPVNSSRGGPRNNGTATPQPYDPNEDDPLEPGSSSSVRSGNAEPNGSHYVVAPSIQVRPEFGSLTRSSQTTQPLTCIIIIELPSRRNSAHIPGPVIQHETPYRTPTVTTPTQQSHSHVHQQSSSQLNSPAMQHSVPGSGRSSPRVRGADDSRSASRQDDDTPVYSYNATPAGDSPFQTVMDDLRNRISDWKGHPMTGLGNLQMFDILCVRRDALLREFYVYLFKEAIICVLEEKKKTLGRLLSSASGTSSNFSGSSDGSNKGILRLKGRIYIRHIKRVIDSSAASELSLTIEMEDERLESFILIFRDRASLESWKTTVTGLVNAFHQSANPSRGLGDMEEFGSPRTTSNKAQKMLSGSSDGSSGQGDSILREGSSRSTLSSATSSHPPSSYGGGSRLQKIPSEELLHYTPPPAVVTPHMSQGPSNSLHPLAHTSMDLILVISVPPPSSAPSTAQLKLKVIKTTLDFIIASLGVRDRLSLVTFEVGLAGKVRKTPFLSMGKMGSRARLVRFVDTLGSQDGDEFVVRTSNEEKTDVVTAVNHGLDVVLQRKSRNAISGMLLVSDASDSTRRAQMDLVLARAEAANVPIHTFGYGRSHDPASLWLMSNHTSGTYTFVKDWYDLRDCLAGCIGGMMSIGLLNMKVHLKVVDGRRFRIRKVSGGPNSIVSTEGHDVDIDVGELRYGERKEMLIELELDNSDALSRAGGGVYESALMGRDGGMGGGGNGGGHSRVLNATDQFVQRMGLDSLSIGDDVNLVDGMMDRMIDEVPVFELDGSFYDPAASKNVSRLAHPVLLTVTLLPMASRQQQLQLQQSPPASDPVIVRRRMELLASDMMTRALVLVSRKNYGQAQKIMSETKRILHTVLHTITQTLPPPSTSGGTVRNRKELLTLSSVRALQSVLQDIQVLNDALEENVELFAHDHRNFGAQQAMILRDQKSWSGRTATEKLFWTTDNSIELVSRSNDWVARD